MEHVRREGLDLLLDVVFEDAEIVGFEAGHEAVIRVRYRDIHEGNIDVAANRPVRLDRDARCVVLYIVKILNFLGSGIVTRSLRISPRTGRHQGEHGEDNYEEAIRNAAASSLAFHGSPVSRLAGTAARYNQRRILSPVNGNTRKIRFLSH